MASKDTNARHEHPINAGDKPGTAKASDWKPGGPEVPAKPTRPLIQPNNDDRRAPSHAVTAITSEGAHSHVAEPVPGKL
jgi:hypothetical protein